MSVTVPTKDLGNVHDKFRRGLGYLWELEDGIEKWIKFNLRLRE